MFFLYNIAYFLLSSAGNAGVACKFVRCLFYSVRKLRVWSGYKFVRYLFL